MSDRASEPEDEWCWITTRIGMIYLKPASDAIGWVMYWALYRDMFRAHQICILIQLYLWQCIERTYLVCVKFWMNFVHKFDVRNCTRSQFHETLQIQLPRCKVDIPFRNVQSVFSEKFIHRVTYRQRTENFKHIFPFPDLLFNIVNLWDWEKHPLSNVHNYTANAFYSVEMFPLGAMYDCEETQNCKLTNFPLFIFLNSLRESKPAAGV